MLFEEKEKSEKIYNKDNGERFEGSKEWGGILRPPHRVTCDEHRQNRQNGQNGEIQAKRTPPKMSAEGQNRQNDRQNRQKNVRLNNT